MSRRTWQQVWRYLAVGLASNLALFAAYLSLTALGLGHKAAATVIYVAGTALTFAFNRRWTFEHRGNAAASFARYCAVYIAGYVLNIGLLFLLVDVGNLPHRAVQGILIFAIAGLLFLAQTWWVFPGRDRSAPLHGRVR